uniref:Myosin motor domain-containing protein n=1 Tax=Macrostomum lignano TaxID=282301 RepID=A0A1I8HRU4_9PLAT
MLNEKFSEVVADVIGFVNEDLHGTNSNTSFTQRVAYHS